jgi:hypothetical protein
MDYSYFYDITNLSNPIVINTISTAEVNSLRLMKNFNYLIYADSGNGITVYDVNDIYNI